MNYSTCSGVDFFNGIEFINYSINNIIVSDPVGIEVEIPSIYDNAPSMQLRGKVVIRITKWVDPKMVKLPTKIPRYDIDKRLLDRFQDKLETALERQRSSGFDILRAPETIQVEESIDFESIDQIVQSHYFGFTIRAEKNKNFKDVYDNPENDVKKYFIPTIEELDRHSINYDEIKRTVCAVRLIDKESIIGDLWTTIFGTVSKIPGSKESKLEDGIYITAGLNFEYALHIPLGKLTEKNLIELNLHKTKIEAQKHSTGEFTKEILEKFTRVSKENKELGTKLEKAKLNITDLNNKLTLGEFKTATTINDLKEKNHNEVRKQGKMIDELKRNNNRLTDENLRLKNAYTDELKDIRKNHQNELYKLNENRTTNTILDVFKGFGIVLTGLVGAAKFFSAINPK